MAVFVLWSFEDMSAITTNMNYNYRYYYCYCILFIFYGVQAEARRLPDIHWNSTNSIFDMSNTDHVIPVRILDRVNFVCPEPGQLYEYTKIYAVSRRSYFECELDSNSQLIGVCQTPKEQSSISLVFREFTPLPGGLEFRPGHYYYFITTSDGSHAGIGNSNGGLCWNRRMRLKFEVLSDEKDYSSSTRGRHRQYDDYRRNGLSSGELSSTPIMYIIHTKSPDEDLYTPYSRRIDGMYRHDEYNDGR